MKILNILLIIMSVIFLTGCSQVQGNVSTQNLEKTENTNIVENNQNNNIENTENIKPQISEVEVEIKEEVVESNLIELTIDSFSFGYSQSEIKVKKGDTVKITLTNSGGFHDFVIDELGVASKKINSGDSTTFEFKVDKVGEFEFYCSIGSHRAQGMVGKFIVEE